MEKRDVGSADIDYSIDYQLFKTASAVPTVLKKVIFCGSGLKSIACPDTSRATKSVEPMALFYSYTVLLPLMLINILNH